MRVFVEREYLLDLVNLLHLILVPWEWEELGADQVKGQEGVQGEHVYQDCPLPWKVEQLGATLVQALPVRD
jgi:hypothetical protein